MKVCTKCETKFPLSGFNEDKSRKDGLQCWCKGCNKQYRQNHKRELKAYREIHKEKMKVYSRQWYLDNKEQIALKKKEYCRTHRLERSFYRRNRYRVDLVYKITCNLRARIRRALKRNQKSGSAVRDLGCSIPELKRWLGDQFYNREDGTKMTWENYKYDGWHIDHIKPLNSFDLQDRRDFFTAVHWTNLQPLWAEDNMKKSSSQLELDFQGV